MIEMGFGIRDSGFGKGKAKFCWKYRIVPRCFAS
jgi:hypothetical protein